MGKRPFLLTLLCWTMFSSTQAQVIENASVNNHLSKTIIVKLKSNTQADHRTEPASEAHLLELTETIPIHLIEKAFPAASKTNSRIGRNSLGNIFRIVVENESDVHRLIGMLKLSPFTEYVEPYIPNAPLYVPDDPQANPTTGQQDYLPVIKAHEAWDLEQADTTVIIGLVDTGVKMDHEDLGNIVFNDADPINGTDDDGDGYIDNFHGWDIADKDNDPTADGHPHGSYVAGMSSATVNNGKGMAGVGFNAKYLPVKIAETETQVFNNEFGGVVYAADHGCKVINLSWGAAGNYTRYGQDVINYAVLERDAVVVAAAGNTNASLNFYPASFDNVLSVGATDIYDKKAPWATYGYAVDLMAPGHNVYTTNNVGTYGRTGGSSYSAPLVSGAAALVRAHFPGLSAQQVMEQLRVTSDDIYSVGSNMDFYGQLGKGRLNVYRALTDTLTPAIRVSKFDYFARFGKLLFPTDTVSMNMTFTNYLRSAKNVIVSITNPTNNTNWQDMQLHLPELLGEMEEFSNPAQPLTFVINPEIVSGEKILFRLDFSGDNYSDFQYVEMQVSPGYFDVSDGILTVTVASDGDIAYDDADYTMGSGIGYLSNYVATEAGLIISTDSGHVMDNVINDINNFKADADFIAENVLKPHNNSTALMDARSSIRPASNASALPLKIEQKVLAWANETQDGYVVFEYRLINIGDSTLTNLNTALYTDWDLGDRKSNMAEYAADDKLAYIYEKPTNQLYAGVALLSEQAVAHYAIDLGDLNGNISDVGSFFSDSAKHALMTGGSPKTQAGLYGDGNDVAQLIGAKDIILPPGQSVKIALAMLGSSSLEGLQQALAAAKENYNHYLNHPPVAMGIISCAGDSVVIDPPGEVHEFYSDLALLHRLDSGLIFTTGSLLDDTVFYSVNLDSAYRGDVMSLLVNTENPHAIIAVSPDSLDLASGNSVTLTDLSENAANSYWILPGEITDDASVLVETYDLPGDYHYELIAESPIGCRDTSKVNIAVFRISGLQGEPASGLEIFPNPVKNTLTIRYPGQIPAAFPIHVVDLTGKVKASLRFPTDLVEYHISFSGWDPGIYIVRSGPYSRKIVVE